MVEVSEALSCLVLVSVSLQKSSFSIQHGPSPQETDLMLEWIDILIAFAHDDRRYDFGTASIDEMKVVTSQDVIEIQKDDKWHHLVELSEVFASG